MKLATLALTSLMILGTAHGATVAVIDSGLDTEHPAFEGKLWVNELERDGLPGVDDDNNGLIDDIHGYDFEHSTGMLLDRSKVSSLSPFIQNYFMLQGQAEFYKLGYDSMEEKDFAWYQNNIGNGEAYSYGHFSHGTHVSGIVAKNNPGVKIMGIKKGLSEVNLTPSLIKNLSNYNVMPLVQLETEFLREVAAYLNKSGARVANGSFGTVYSAVINRFLGVFHNSKPMTEIKYIAKTYQQQLLMMQEQALMTSPKTLYVFAAGNSGLDNDVHIFTPANVDTENAITVAATVGRNHLPDFSCYGKTTVHLAAPGVGIESTVPGGETMQMTGTSQAAPYVSNVASKVIDMNEELSSGQVKRILMETVDKKDFLKGKVISEGIVNEERAIYASQLSMTMDLNRAIQIAIEEVKDIK